MTSVNCSFIQLKAERYPSNYLGDDVITIYYVDVTKLIPLLSHFQSILNGQEIQRSLTFLKKADRDSFIVRRGILRFLLGHLLNYPARSIEFNLGENKRPGIRLPLDVPLTFSSSHSSGTIAIAIGKCLLGIDIEHINPLFEYQDIAQQFFSKSEYEYILKSSDPIKTFFILWTRKEALLKANSFGIDDDLNLVPSLDGETLSSHPGLTKSDSWQVKSFNPEADYIISVASSVEAKFVLVELNNEDFDLK